jgi:hypothetical protein
MRRLQADQMSNSLFVSGRWVVESDAAKKHH